MTKKWKEEKFKSTSTGFPQIESVLCVVKSVTMRFVVTRRRKLWDIMTFAAIWPFTIGHMHSVTFAKRLPHAFNLIKKQKKNCFYCVIIHSGFAISHLHLSRRVWPIVSPLDIDSRKHTQTQCVITIKRQLMSICLFNRGLRNTHPLNS